jgi:FkbM family methyltransferase
MKNSIKRIFNLFGLHLSKFNAFNVPAYQTVQALKAHNINVVFDIGANIGQFAIELREYGYMGKIVSFEPLPQAYQGLISRADGDEHWIVHPQCAVGAAAGEIEINVAANSASSSILPMLSAHETSAPHAKYTHKERVTLITLDSVLEQYAAEEDNIFIKIDTQGYEWAVLDGAEQALNQSKGVLLELSLIPLYEGQKLWLDLVNRLVANNYFTFAIQPGFTDTKTGQTLQVDGLFFKKIIG